MALNHGNLAIGIQQIHPLQNHLIYTELFKYVQKSCWKSCRLVCRAWNDELLQRFREQTTVHIKDSSQRCLNRPPARLGYLNCLEFVSDNRKDPYQFGKQPFRHVEAGLFTTLDDASSKFWILSGRWLYSLHFNRVLIKSNESFKNLIQQWTPNLKHFQYSYCEVETNDVENGAVIYTKPTLTQSSLTSFTLSLSEALPKPETYEFQWHTTFPIRWISFFNTFPNLETIKLPDMGKKLWPTICHILEAIEIIRTNLGDSVLNIKHLSALQINSREPDLEFGVYFAFEKLVRLTFPLESLHLSVNPEVSSALLRSLFVAYEPTLTHLCLKRDAAFGSYLVSCYLPNRLTTLELIGPVFRTWKYLGYIPNLVKLVVDVSQCDQEIYPHVEDVVTIESLETFEYKTTLPISGKSLTFFGSVMPSLKSLVINVDCAGFRQLCYQWNDLEDLKLFWACVCERTFVHKIVSLNRLKSVSFEYGRNPQIFGNLSITQGYLKLLQLRHLVAAFSANTSETVLEQLKSRLDYESKVMRLSYEQSQRAFHNVGCDELCQLIMSCHVRQ